MASTRLGNYKNKGKNVEDLRRQRSEASVELRKAKKDEQFSKRRNLIDENHEKGEKENKNEANVPLMSSKEIKQALSQKTDPELLFNGVQSVRRMLSRERNPPIDSVIKMDLLPILVTYLDCFDKPKIQFEAAWALTNIASGTSEQTRKVVEAGAVKSFIKLLSSNNFSVTEQAVWALGNIAGDGPDMRDTVLAENAMPSLLALFEPVIQENNLAFMRNLTWCVSNLCRNRNPPPPFSAIQQCLPTLVKLLYCTDKEVVTDAAWALSYISDGSNDLIQHVIDSGAVGKLIDLLSCSEVCILTPVVRAVGNIVTGSDLQTQYVLDSGVLKHFKALLQHPRVGLQKEAVWMISNITAGNRQQVQMVIDEGLIPIIINLLFTADFKVQKEAVWVLNNLIFGEVHEQIDYCIQMGVVVALCNLLECEDSRLLMVILDCISTILKTAQAMDRLEEVCCVVEECEGLDKIEKLQVHLNEDIYKASLKIIKTYFSDEDEEAGDGTLDSCKVALNF